LVGPSGGTLETRAAMSAGDKWVREKMQDNFALGGLIDSGNRLEDQDAYLSKIKFDNKYAKKWLAPHVYSFFETRIVRRSNWLHHQLVGGPKKGDWYGAALHFSTFTLANSQKEAENFKNKSTSTKLEEKQLKEQGKYYKAGEGPPFEELLAMGVFSLYHVIAVSDTGKTVKLSIKGRDGYYETARFVVEMAMTLALDSPTLRTGPKHVKGGLLTPAVAGRSIFFKRLLNSGMGFIDFSDQTDIPEPTDPNYNMPTMTLQDDTFYDKE